MAAAAMGFLEAKKPYLIALAIQIIGTGMFVMSKAAFDDGLSTFVFIFYRMAAASLILVPTAIVLQRKNIRSMTPKLLLKLFFLALIGNTFSLNTYNMSMKLTTATVGSALANAVPVFTFCLVLMLRMETVNLRTLPGVAKVAGVALCVGGVVTIAFYAGPGMSPVNHHHAFAAPAHASSSSSPPSRTAWITGTLLMVVANISWSLWIVLQSALLKEYPNRMLVTAAQGVFSMMQSFVVALVAEKGDMSKWKLRMDITLVAVLYVGFVVTGLSHYLQAWCMELKGPVFLAITNPLCFVFTMFCSSFFLGEIVHLGSILGGALLVAGLYSVHWGKLKEDKKSEEEGKTTTNKEEAAAGESSALEQA